MQMGCIIHFSLNGTDFRMAGKNRKRPTPASAATPLPLYTAAIRYRDGTNELLRIKNALDIDDARKVAMEALMNVHLVLIAELKRPLAKEAAEISG
jgi:hypothetical protein